MWDCTGEMWDLHGRNVRFALEKFRCVKFEVGTVPMGHRNVGPHPLAAGNLYVVLYWTACPRERPFRCCPFRGWQFKYNTRKCALRKVEVLNLSELSVLSNFQSFLRLNQLFKFKTYGSRPFPVIKSRLNKLFHVSTYTERGLYA